jgi:hypothetical protein
VRVGSRLSALRAILAFSVVSTAAHYAHNFFEIDSYPGGGAVQQALILLSWPALTAIGLYGYLLYERGDVRRAHACLLIYSLTGLITPLHFAYGEPDIPPFFYATLFTDFIAGVAVVAFVVWSASQPAGWQNPPSALHGRREVHAGRRTRL